MHGGTWHVRRFWDILADFTTALTITTVDILFIFLSFNILLAYS